MCIRCKVKYHYNDSIWIGQTICYWWMIFSAEVALSLKENEIGMYVKKIWTHM